MGNQMVGKFDDVIKRFSSADLSEFPDFYQYQKPLEMGLWVLWVGKDKLKIKKLSAEQIAVIIRDVKEVSIDAKSITKSFNRAKDKIHTYTEDGEAHYEIMKRGKDHLLSMVKRGLLEVFYFEPGKKYTSKKILSKNILDTLRGELKIVDPYCSERTLDVLKSVNNKSVKFLTQTSKLKEKDKNKLLRELRDFKSEFPNIEFRDYLQSDIHDRYIISSNFLVILGHSIKDLGSKESFAVVLDNKTSKNIVEALIEVFNRRWKQSAVM